MSLLASSTTPPPIPPSIYFGGCAYGSCYYVGVYKAMLEVWGSDFASKTLLTGDSAGVILVVGITLQYTPEFIKQMYCDSSELTPWGLFDKDPFQAIDKCTLQKLITGPDEKTPMKDTYKKLNQKIRIGASVFPDKHYWVDSWNSDKELLHSMRNTLHLPIICHRRFHTHVNDQEVVDGAFCMTGKDMAHGDQTLYIGTNKGADVFAELTVKQTVLPNRGIALHELEELGYVSFMRWAAEGGIIKKKNKKVRYLIQCILWVCKGLDLIQNQGTFVKEWVYGLFLKAVNISGPFRST